MTGFAPALGRRKRPKSNTNLEVNDNLPSGQTPDGSFAPALKRLRKNGREMADDDDHLAAPKYAAQPFALTSTWQSIVPSTGEVVYEAPRNPGELDDGISWVDRHSSTAYDDSAWVEDQNLLENRPAGRFEANNASVLPLNINLNNIQTVHGAVRISVDNRVTMLDAEGSYKDGKWRGAPKQRVLDEFKRRYEEREQEKAVWREKIDRWNALSEDAKEARRQDNRDRLRSLMESFQMLAIENTPEDYEDGPFEMSDFIQALDNNGDSRSRQLPYNGYGEQRESPGPSYNINISYSPTPSTTNSSSSSRNVYNQRSDQGGSTRSSRNHGRPRRSIESAVSAHSSPSMPAYSSLATPTTIRFPLRARVHWSDFSRPPSQAPAPEPDVAWSRFEVTCHPDYMPFESIVLQTTTQTDELEKKVARIIDLNSRKGRVVTVRMPDTVTRSFSEAICDRLFGGMIQEIQFFPDSHHAVICFLTPVAASAFVRHVYNVRHNSQHEYLRLQIASAWYQDNEHSAIYPAQEEIVRAVVYDNASRVIEISGIETGLRLHEVSSSLKSSIGLEHLIVKGRLVVPTKMYERTANSNRMILEMASIRDAVDVKNMVNTDGLRDFPQAMAAFTKDPIDSPTVEKPFCDCKYCKVQRNTAVAA